MPGPTPHQPGWYDDGDGQERWYDGNAWTDHVRGEAAGEPGGLSEDTVVVPTAQTGTGELPRQDPPGPNPLAVPAQLQVGRGLRLALAIGGVLLLIGVVVAGAIVLLGGDEEPDRAGDEASSESTTGSAPADEDSSLDVPTIDPSDFPTDAPTTERSSDVPDLPELPSGLPSGFPSDIPAFPTNPSDLDSWFSDYLEQMNP